VAVDSAGNVYASDMNNNTIRKVTPAGVVTTVAGLAASHGSADGTRSTARFDYPYGVAVDSAGNAYVADTINNTIRKVTPAGVVTTLAGFAGSSGSADGTGSAARFYNPYSVAVDSAGNVYVADTRNFTIRKVTPSGVVTTLAGVAGYGGSADGWGGVARFYCPWGVAVDSAGNVYVADSNNHTIRRITPGRVVSTLAGLAGSYGSADGTGSDARFKNPYGVAVDNAGNVYVADSGNSTIRKVTPDGVVTTLAGLAGSYGSADGTGSAARFKYPDGVAVDSADNVYVADTYNCTIRKVTPGGVVTTLAGVAGSTVSGPAVGGGVRRQRRRHGQRRAVQRSRERGRGQRGQRVRRGQQQPHDSPWPPCLPGCADD
jgi:sugar lactone lactonase YvrE